jgi:hypothetical protein
MRIASGTASLCSRGSSRPFDTRLAGPQIISHSILHLRNRSRDSLVGRATDCMAGVGRRTITRQFHLLQSVRANLGPLSLLSDGYQGALLCPVQSFRGVKVTTHLCLVLRSRLYFPYVFMEWCLINYSQGHIYLYFYL